MFKLRTGYFISGIAIGFILLFSFIWSLPDGKLHLFFCNVGQGDAAYIRFPDGRDMLIDGGPNDQVLGCLGRHMPFWDRGIDLVVLTHPQRDHLQGLISVLGRFRVDYFIRSDVENSTEGFSQLKNLIKEKKITEKLVFRGEQIALGRVIAHVLWPSREQIAFMKPPSDNLTIKQSNNILGVQTPSNLNDASVVMSLRYGSFDALFPGDADNHVNFNFINTSLADGDLEVLKVPHHGSKTGMNQAMLDWLYPDSDKANRQKCNNLTIQQFNNLSCPLAVISVGKNSYGHPAAEALSFLSTHNVQVLRTDQKGDIEITTDGLTWSIKTKR